MKLTDAQWHYVYIFYAVFRPSRTEGRKRAKISLRAKEVRFYASIFMKLVNCSTALRVHLPYRIFPKPNENVENKRQNFIYSRQHGFHCTDFHDTRNFKTTLHVIYHTKFHKFGHEIWQSRVESIYSIKYDFPRTIFTKLIHQQHYAYTFHAELPSKSVKQYWKQGQKFVYAL